MAESPDSFFKATSDPTAKDPKTKFPLDGYDILKVPKVELVAAAATAPALHALSSTRVARVSQDLVIKSSHSVLPSEAEAMKMVSQKTSIHLPRVYRSFTIQGTDGIYDSTGYIVMDYVDGCSLTDCWSGLTVREREDIVKQVVDIIRQLQSLRLPKPGPIGGGPSKGTWFSCYGAGPFANRSEFEEYFNQRLEIAKKTGSGGTQGHTPPFRFSTFVMTHLDITPRNLILDPKGRLWLIDWGYAGAYPPIFEPATLACQSECPDFNDLVLQRLAYDDQSFQQLIGIRGVLHFRGAIDVCHFHALLNFSVIASFANR
ncbi:kinase-like domain-containing protein [Lineolata rhizophorae]|uniref:Kinase-like domain-containing protein n=1 Tax=Lineolata rhizophorae TaxID=578093 RepID=A0A6A6PEK3_9PEZI|nr:kinase-like domain-containing protein [Lineolata rhizophorae]